jgi:hypothetical protein
MRGIYFVLVHTGEIKIGFATDVPKRIIGLRSSMPHEPKVLAIIPDGTRDDEARLHLEFAEYRLHGEWYKNAPAILNYAALLPRVEAVRLKRRTLSRRPISEPPPRGHCRQCGKELPPREPGTKGRDKQVCDGACRTAYYRRPKAQG